MECQIAVESEKYKSKGININVWHPVTHIHEYLDLDIMVLNGLIKYWID